MKSLLLLTALVFFSQCGSELIAKPLRLKLPTINTGLVDGNPQKFYMYVDRNTDGVSSRPWTGGKYGYWRTLVKTSEGLTPVKFHEGVDIAPVKRDSAGRPLDIVHSIADGEVVYTNSSPSKSNYGNYVVVKHDWECGPFYSLYAHLATVNCKTGQKVRAQSPLGRLGYTGAGINLRRAHLHLELCIMSHPDFSYWHKHHFTSMSQHGPYNGMNLSGLDIASLFISNNTNPNLTIPTFLKNTPVQFKVTIPRESELAICCNYPWMKKGNHDNPSPSWEISFSNSGFPLAVEPSSKEVNTPFVSYAKPENFSQKYRSRGFVTGSSKTASLTSLGSRYIQLLTGSFPRN